MFLDITAPVMAESEIEIAASPKEVWAILSDLERWPEWDPDVSSMQVEGEFKPGTVFRWKAGGGFRIVSTLQYVEEGKRIMWTGETFGTRAVHEWELKEMDNEVLVETRECFGGWMPTLLPGLMQKGLQRSLDEGLQHLKKRAESA